MSMCDGDAKNVPIVDIFGKHHLCPGPSPEHQLCSYPPCRVWCAHSGHPLWALLGARPSPSGSFSVEVCWLALGTQTSSIAGLIVRGSVLSNSTKHWRNLMSVSDATSVVLARTCPPLSRKISSLQAPSKPLLHLFSQPRCSSKFSWECLVSIDNRKHQ